MHGDQFAPCDYTFVVARNCCKRATCDDYTGVSNLICGVNVKMLLTLSESGHNMRELYSRRRSPMAAKKKAAKKKSAKKKKK